MQEIGFSISKVSWRTKTTFLNPLWRVPGEVMYLPAVRLADVPIDFTQCVYNFTDSNCIYTKNFHTHTEPVFTYLRTAKGSWRKGSCQKGGMKAFL